jgi:hypothetical protein
VTGRPADRVDIAGVGPWTTIEKVDPAELHEPEGYTNVVVAAATERVFLAWQVGVGLDDAVVGAENATLVGVHALYRSDLLVEIEAMPSRERQWAGDEPLVESRVSLRHVGE